MPPCEDARLLLNAEDWGFTAQQAVEKLLKCSIVLADEEPPRSHELSKLASLAKLVLPNILLDLQPFAVEANYRNGDFPLPAERSTILEGIRELMVAFQAAIDASEEIK